MYLAVLVGKFVKQVVREWYPSTPGPLLPTMGGALCAVLVLCPRCTKSRLFSTTNSHGSQGPECCTLQPRLVHPGFVVLV